MRWWITGCALVLLLVVVSSASIISESSDGCMGVPAAPALPADPDRPSVITVTVTTVNTSDFVEVPGYIVVLRNGPAISAASVGGSEPAHSLSVSVYTVKAGEEAVAFAVGYQAPEGSEEQAGAGVSRGETALYRGREESEIPALSSNSLPVLPGFGGRNRYYLLEIAPNMTSFWVDLEWNDPDRPLTLTLYHPGGVLGTYDDGSDGREDGRIYLRVSNEAGIAEGNWFLKISGSKSFTSRNYAFTTYLG
jgi:hypothetical protein